jgi:hypothetical protein
VWRAGKEVSRRAGAWTPPPLFAGLEHERDAASKGRHPGFRVSSCLSTCPGRAMRETRTDFVSRARAFYAAACALADVPATAIATAVVRFIPPPRFGQFYRRYTHRARRARIAVRGALGPEAAIRRSPSLLVKDAGRVRRSTTRRHQVASASHAAGRRTWPAWAPSLALAARVQPAVQNPDHLLKTVCVGDVTSRVASSRPG